MASTPYGQTTLALTIAAMPIYTQGKGNCTVNVITLSNETAGAITPTLSLVSKTGETLVISKPAALAAGTVTTVAVAWALNEGDKIVCASTVAGLKANVAVTIGN